MGKTNTKKMVQGAMVAAIFGALSLFNTYTGSMFDIFICYAMVIPLAWYGYTYSVKDNMIVCIVSMFVIAMMGLPFFVISSFSSCLAGLFIGEALRRKASKEMILFGTFLVALLNNILLYEVFAGLLGINLIQEMTMSYQEICQWIPTISQTISLDTFLSFIPIVLIIMSIMEMYVIVLLCQLTLSRLKVEFPGSFHIATMHLNRKVGIVLMITMFGSYILKTFVGIDNVYLNYLYILSIFVFGLQGLSFVSFYLIAKQRQRWIAFAFIALLIPFVSPLYVVVGILDIFSDLRRNILYNNDYNE